MPIPINEKKLALLEAVLFTTTGPLTFEELQKLTRASKSEMDKLIVALNERYVSESFGIKLSDIGGYKLIVKSEYAPQVNNLTPHADMSRGLLRVLSIIAYHEPIRQSEIVKVIGNRTYDYVKELTERGLIKVEKKSRTRILTTTPRFEEYFDTKKEALKKNMDDFKEDEEEKRSDKRSVEEGNSSDQKV